MNGPSFIMLLLLACSAAYSQEPSDPARSEAEMEDSISAMSFVRIKKPKALLDSIIVQIVSELDGESVRCKYMVEETSGLHLPVPTTSRCTFPCRASVRIKAARETENFYYDGTTRLRNSNDTARIWLSMKDFCLEGDYMLGAVQKDCMNEGTISQSFQQLMSLHHVKVYRISDGSGRGVYRVDFSPRKHIGYGWAGSKFTGTAYFDSRLRLMQIRTDKVSPSSFDIMGRQAKEPLSHTHMERYRMDFDETGGRNVVRQIEDSIFVDNQLSTTYIIKRLP